jgi:hypothetical protein
VSNSFLLTSFCLLYIICNISVKQQAGLLAALSSSPMINATHNDGDQEGSLGFSGDVEFGSPVGIPVSLVAASSVMQLSMLFVIREDVPCLELASSDPGAKISKFRLWVVGPMEVGFLSINYVVKKYLASARHIVWVSLRVLEWAHDNKDGERLPFSGLQHGIILSPLEKSVRDSSRKGKELQIAWATLLISCWYIFGLLLWGPGALFRYGALS